MGVDHSTHVGGPIVFTQRIIIHDDPLTLIIGEGAALSSDIKTEDLSADFTFYPLVTGPVHSCVISTPQRASSPEAISPN